MHKTVLSLKIYFILIEERIFCLKRKRPKETKVETPIREGAHKTNHNISHCQVLDCM